MVTKKIGSLGEAVGAKLDAAVNPADGKAPEGPKAESKAPEAEGKAPAEKKSPVQNLNPEAIIGVLAGIFGTTAEKAPAKKAPAKNPQEHALAEFLDAASEAVRFDRPSWKTLGPVVKKYAEELGEGLGVKVQKNGALDFGDAESWAGVDRMLRKELAKAKAEVEGLEDDEDDEDLKPSEAKAIAKALDKARRTLKVLEYLHGNLVEANRPRPHGVLVGNPGIEALAAVAAGAVLGIMSAVMKRPAGK